MRKHIFFFQAEDGIRDFHETGVQTCALPISAGYDAHRDDPLGECMVETEGYGEMAAPARDLAAELGAPVLLCLEGGYDRGALATSVIATVRALDGDGVPRTAPVEPAQAHIERHRRHWPDL